MALYLVQHGVTTPKPEDPTQGLCEAGRQDVIRIAEVARGYEVKVSKILHSGKKRALQTAELLAQYLTPPGDTAQMDGLAPLDDVIAFAADLNMAANCMYVGHLPFMSRLVSHLITGDPERPVFAFQNGGIVCLDTIAPVAGPVIKWALMPKIQ